MGLLEQAILVLSTLAFVFTALFILNFSGGLSNRKRARVWLIAAFGFLMYSLYNYLQITFERDVVKALTVLNEYRALWIVEDLASRRGIVTGLAATVGSVSILYGLLAIFYDIRGSDFMSRNTLMKRRAEIERALNEAARKYSQGRMSSSEFSSARAGLIKELLDIESRTKG